MLRFASRTWDGWDYIPHAWPVWLTAPDGVLLVGTAGQPADGSAALDTEGTPLTPGEPIALSRIALLSATEGWVEGIRVDPLVRGLGVATDLQAAELQWLAAHQPTVIRYATGEWNEASHRLGGRHGFELLTHLRSWIWQDPAAPDDPAAHEEANGFDEPARLLSSRRRRAALTRLAQAGRLVATDDAPGWWERVAANPTFAAAGGLYELRAWAMQELTAAGLARHVAAGEVLAIDEKDGWALVILPAEAMPTEDVSLHLALLVGEGSTPARLAGEIQHAAGELIRFRQPADADPERAGDGAFEAAGFVARPTELHILARAASTALPPIESARLVLADAPQRVIKV